MTNLRGEKVEISLCPNHKSSLKKIQKLKKIPNSKFSLFYFSMRSLCKTLLNNTNPATTSACDRAKVLVEILSKVVSKDDDKDKLDDAKILSVATSVKVEQEEVQNLKSVLGTQGTLRPIFEGQLKQKRAVREHAISLRKLVAEAGLQYSDLAQIYENSQESRHETLKARIGNVQLYFIL